MLIQGDAARIPLLSKSVHTVVTSPPYWGLRSYAGEQCRIWGGDVNCSHTWATHTQLAKGGRNSPDNPPNTGGNKIQQAVDSPRFGVSSQYCVKCGAWYGALGQEPTPEEFIEHIVIVFRELRRVLRDDGTIWLNLGDCYSGGGRGAGGVKSKKQKSNTGSLDCAPSYKKVPAGNLMLIPHRVALALQTDGWILRNDNIWHKTNPMPESVRGWRWEQPNCKCGTRNPKRGIDPEESMTGDGRYSSGGSLGDTPWTIYDKDCPLCHGSGKQDKLVLRKGNWRHTRSHEYIFQLVKSMDYYSNRQAIIATQETISNPRSVFSIPTASYAGAHYATYPEALVMPLIRASCPTKCCPECGAPWAPVLKSGKYIKHESEEYDLATKGKGANKSKHSKPFSFTTVGSLPTCSCGHEDCVAGIVLDPFVGSGTVPKVANLLRRRWIGLDISYPYLDEQARVRAKFGKRKTKISDLPLFKMDKKGE